MKHSLLTILFLLAASCGLWAQATHPERIYLSGTGIDDTRTWEFRCSKGRNSGRWMPIEVRVCRNKRCPFFFSSITKEKFDIFKQRYFEDFFD